MKHFWLFIYILAFSPIIIIMAQDGERCPAIVETALNALDDACISTGRNQLCYGNVHVEATPFNELEWVFENTGDLIDIADVQNIRLSSMNLEEQIWGITVMRIQANLPDTSLSQNVSFLLFGDVDLANEAPNIVEINAVASGNVNVRLRPTTNTNNIMTSLVSTQEVVAVGQLEDSSWILIKVEEDARGYGWVSSGFLSSDSDLSTLAVLSPAEEIYGPMQAIQFRSGIGDSQCSESPDSGILVQTPEGARNVNLHVNGVDITLGSTAYLRADETLLRVDLLSGSAIVTANGVRQAVPAGTYTTIELTDGIASSSPAFPQPYNLDDFVALPLDVVFDEIIEVATPLTPEEIATGITLASGGARSGQWRRIRAGGLNDCPFGGGFSSENPTQPFSLSYSDDGTSLTMQFPYEEDWYFGEPSVIVLSEQNFIQQSEGVYVMTLVSPRGPYTRILTVTSPTVFNIYSSVPTYHISGTPCTLERWEDYEYVG